MRALRTAAFYGLLVALWQVLASLKVWDPALFPGPMAVFRTFSDLLESGALSDATSVSLRRVLVGYGVSLGLGVPLGVLVARCRLAEETVGTLVTGLQALPSICWLPLALLWFGLNDRAILFVVVMGSMVSVTVAISDGVKNLPPTYVRAARTMGATPFRLVTDVLLPASLPSILVGAKLGWSYAWRALMAGELLFVSMGLGHLLMMGRELGDMSQVMSVMILISGLGLFTDRVIFGALERRMRARFGLGLVDSG